MKISWRRRRRQKVATAARRRHDGHDEDVESGGIALSLACALALIGACDQPPLLALQQYCASVCDCVAPLPAEHAQCESSCTTQLAGTVVPDACLECLDEPLCTLRETCVRACVPQPGGTP